MLKIDILAIGKLKKGPYKDLADEYARRIQWPLALHEFESVRTDPAAQQADESRKLADKINDQAVVIALDERGDGLRSLDFAATLRNLQDSGEDRIQFLIGGANGLTDDLRDRADILLGFGQQTWPHMLVRIMLLEQIYRAGQILSGHPYHREG